MNTLTAFVPVSQFWPSTILALAITTVGCARDRDFAVVEPGLSRQYQANAMLAAAPPAPNVVGVQQVAGQRNTAVPVYQAQAPAAVPANATVAPPPSSTATTGGQPYYMLIAPTIGTRCPRTSANPLFACARGHPSP